MSGGWRIAHILAAGALCWCALGARAEVHPARGSGDPRIRTAAYQPDEVYRIHGFVGFQLDLEFEGGERFVGLAAGDIEGLSFTAQDNHLFLKPRVAAVGTNLTVLTSRRHYHFYYTATSERPEPTDPELIYAVRFLYAPQVEEASRALVAERLDRPAGATPNLDYWYCGAASLQPLAASDDGVRTRLRFAPRAELPAIFVRNEDGSESLLNFNMQGADLVIHRIAHRLILRRGKLTGCIVNRSFSGGGVRLDSGTVTPGVERIRKEEDSHE